MDTCASNGRRAGAKRCRRVAGSCLQGQTGSWTGPQRQGQSYQHGMRVAVACAHVGANTVYALMQSGAKARAVLDGRPTPEIADIVALAKPVMRHRIVRSFRAEADAVDTDDIIERLLETIKA